MNKMAIDGYFISWENPSRVNTAVPEWIPLTKLCFDFTKDIDLVRQKQGFRDLIPTMIQQFSENEIEIACFQYTNIVKRVQNIQAADAGDSTEPPSLKSIVYRLCTTPALYSGCEMALTVMLYNICVTVSECGIESLISSIAQSNTSTRPISLKQLQSEVNIRKNGPHPLLPSEDKFLHDTLCRHFGGGPEKWNFTRTNNIGSQFSKVIARHINSAPLPKL